MTDTRYSCSEGVNWQCCGSLCHFSMQPLQQVAIACWAINTVCPRIGVCLPSFVGSSGAGLCLIKA